MTQRSDLLAFLERGIQEFMPGVLDADVKAEKMLGEDEKSVARIAVNEATQAMDRLVEFIETLDHQYEPAVQIEWPYKCVKDCDACRGAALLAELKKGEPTPAPVLRYKCGCPAVPVDKVHAFCVTHHQTLEPTP